MFKEEYGPTDYVYGDIYCLKCVAPRYQKRFPVVFLTGQGTFTISIPVCISSSRIMGIFMTRHRAVTESMPRGCLSFVQESEQELTVLLVDLADKACMLESGSYI